MDDLVPARGGLWRRRGQVPVEGIQTERVFQRKDLDTDKFGQHGVHDEERRHNNEWLLRAQITNYVDSTLLCA